MRLLPRILAIHSLLLFAACVAPAPAPASTPVEPRSGAGGASAVPGRVKLWVYFRDHGEADASGLRALIDRADIPARARERRVRRMGRGGADAHDLQVSAAYVDALRALGCTIRRESRYLNAVSAWVDPRQVAAIEALPFVQRTEPVHAATRPAPIDPAGAGGDGGSPAPRAPAYGAPGPGAAIGTPIDYGFSAQQNRQINTPPLHAAGYHGEGVRIAVLDTGFFLDHDAFSTLDVVGEWDFINDDPVTADQLVDGSLDTWGQMSHGTSVLGALACNLPGQAMGTAWGAEYILAKTERLLYELRTEEDDFVAALEWADYLGADLVSSSLGYYDWYDFEDLDGNTAITTRAVDIAASRGILVVTCAGNEGGLPWPTLLVPADADSAIAVGATDSLGAVTAWSSRGPTYDGRIKPDVVALGWLVVTAYWDNPELIWAFAGTSASTPLVAGACALILQRHPDWSPIRVRDALRATASHAGDPDNDHGWGIPDAVAASGLRDTVAVVVRARAGSCAGPFNPGSRGVLPALLLGSDAVAVVDIDPGTVRLAGAAPLRSEVGDLDGSREGLECGMPAPDGRDDLLLQFRSAEISAAIGSVGKGDVVPLALTGALRDGTPIAGRALVTITGAQGEPSRAGGILRDAIAAVIPDGARPNPFNPVTWISYRVPQESRVELSVFDVSGRRVASLVDAVQPAGAHTVPWDASAYPSGVYFYRVRIGDVEEMRRLVLVK